MENDFDKTIALFLPSLDGGGAEKVFVTLAKQFSAMGIKVDLVLVSAEGPYLRDVPANVRIVNLNKSRVIFSLKSLVKYLKASEPIAVLSAMEPTNVIAILAQKISGVKTRVVVSVHTVLSIDQATTPFFTNRFTQYWIKPFYKHAHKVVAVSRGVADDLVKLIGLPEKKLEVIYNPIVTDELFIKMSQRLDHDWFNSPSCPVILSAGRLNAAKDFSTLLRAFKIVRSNHLCRLIILGEGEERAQLKQLASELNIEIDFSLPGFVDNPFSYMKRAELFVLSSRWEGFGNVLAEAMACGIKVVSTDCPFGPAEILEGGKWGTLVPLGDENALAAAIQKQLFSDPPIGLAESVMDRFNEKKIATEYLKILVS